MKEANELYDCEAIHDEKIYPLMEQIIAICREHQIPFTASFAYANSPEHGEELCSTYVDFDRRKPETLLTVRKVLTFDMQKGARQLPTAVGFGLTGVGQNE